jgi:ERCC4-related helicase
MMPSFSIEKIRKLAANNQTYQRGMDYYAHHLVKQLSYNPTTRRIDALVNGSKNYPVWIELREDESIKTFSCDCQAFFDYNGACKHIIATLLHFGAKDSSVPLTLLKNNSIPAARVKKEDLRLATSHALIAALLHQTQAPVQNQVKLKVTLYKDPAGSLPPCLEIQLGMTRLYVVKKLRELIEAIEFQRELYFGKAFTLQPKIHTFHPQDQPLIDLLLDLYRDERNVWNYRSDFDKHRFELRPSQLRRFLAFAGGMTQAFWQKNYNDPPRRIVVSQATPPLALQVEQGPQYVEIVLQPTEPLIFLTSAKDIIVANDQFYLLTARTARPLAKLWETLMEHPDHRLPLADREAVTFLTQLKPLIQQFCRLEIAPAVQNRLYHEPLTIALWLDKYHKNGISLKLRFLYGAIEVDPLAETTIVALPKGQLLLRDTAAETAFLQQIEAAGFVTGAESWTLSDEDRIYQFLQDTLPGLITTCQVYRSEAFVKLQIKPAPRLSGAIRLNETSDLLEISLADTELPPNELAAFWAAVREKQKYYRMKNGDFIDLTAPETQSAGKLLTQLGIGGADFQKDLLTVPKYRAFYLEQAIRAYGIEHFTSNAALEQLVQTVQNPQTLAATLPVNLAGIMRDYQKTGFKWLKALTASGFGGILADDMGLGKTLQIIAWAQSEYARSPLPSLVIAPTSLIYNWREEVAKFAPELSVLVLDGTKEERLERLQYAHRYALVITSYPLIRRDIEAMQQIQFACCILDEAQNIKNPATINAKTAKKIQARHHFAVTGTPIENSLTELWSIFDFIMPGYLYSHHKFQARFETPVVRQNDPEALADLGQHIRPFILRRLKKDVLTELPEKIETKLSCEMTEWQKKAYLAYLAQARHELETELDTNGFEKSQIKILALITRLRQICCHPALFLDHYSGGSGKLELLLELIQESRSGGHRLLIFSQFVTMLDLIAAQLQAEKIPYSRIDGQTPSAQRLDLVNAFNAGATEVFLISLKAGGTGLNLTGADTVIHYDPWWNPAVEDQATDRAYRIGQQHVVQVFKLVTHGTIEEKIFTLQQKKKELIDSVIKPGENFLGKMTLTEIKGLFAE